MTATPAAPPPAVRPDRLIVVTGTDTNIGKTWLACELLRHARDHTMHVAARKPVQSYIADEHQLQTDAELLADASGQHPHEVCPPHRCYQRAMTPPMAAETLGLPAFYLDDLLSELNWQPGLSLGVVETVGGVRSPIAADADSAGLARGLRPDLTILVTGAQLGTINAARLAHDTLTPLKTVIYLNHYEPDNELHRRNHEWLAVRDGYTLATDIATLWNLLPLTHSSAD